MKKLSDTQIAIDLVFKPDENGVSGWITRDTIQAHSALNWGNNGVSRHGVFFDDKRYIWEKLPKSGKITHLRLSGINPDADVNTSRPIRDDIHAYHKKNECVVCGSRASLVTDHKNDLYNDQRVLNTTTQTIDDFQCLCNHCNLQKREVVKQCKATGCRYPATNIPQLRTFGIKYILGDDTFDSNDPNAMVGTYWYDPVAFMDFINNRIV